MPTDPTVRAIRRETVTVGVAVVLSFSAVGFVNTTYPPLAGFWRYALWFGLGMVMVVVLVTVLSLAGRLLLGPEKE